MPGIVCYLQTISNSQGDEEMRCGSSRGFPVWNAHNHQQVSLISQLKNISAWGTDDLVGWLLICLVPSVSSERNVPGSELQWILIHRPLKRGVKLNVLKYSWWECCKATQSEHSNIVTWSGWLARHLRTSLESAVTRNLAEIIWGETSACNTSAKTFTRNHINRYNYYNII